MLSLKGKTLILGSYRFGTNLIAVQRELLGGTLEIIAPLRDAFEQETQSKADGSVREEYRLKIIEVMQNHFQNYGAVKLMYEDVLFMEKCFSKEYVLEFLRQNHVIFCIRTNIRAVSISLEIAKETNIWFDETDKERNLPITIDISALILSLRKSYGALKGLTALHSKMLPNCETFIYPEIEIEGLIVTRQFTSEKTKLFEVLFDGRIHSCQKYSALLKPLVDIVGCSLNSILRLKFWSLFIGSRTRSMELKWKQP